MRKRAWLRRTAVACKDLSEVSETTESTDVKDSSQKPLTRLPRARTCSPPCPGLPIPSSQQEVSQ